MSGIVLRNGLTQEQADKARAILKKATISKVAEVIGTNAQTLHNILRDASSDIQLLNQALLAANKLISDREELLKNLPV